MTSTTVAVAEVSTWTRAWRRPLAAHVAALVLVLLALMPLLGTSRLFAVDEATVAAQATLLADGDGWLIDHPRPDLDQDGRHFPIDLVSIKGDQAAPFAKHPVYAVALTPFEWAGGKPAMVLTSLAGTVLVALVTALIAGRLRPGRERPTFWVVGLASPLFLHGWLLIAHTLGAALAGLAVLLAIGPRQTNRRLIGLATAVALCVTLRSEALLFGVALALAAALAGWIHRERRYLLVAAAAVVGAAGGNVLDNALANLVVSGQSLVSNTAASRGTGDLVADRAYGSVLTWLVPSYDGLGVSALLLVTATVLAVSAVLVARRRPEDHSGVRLLVALAAVCSCGRLLLPAHPVPGLLVAFPLLTVGLVALRGRGIARRPEPLVAAVTFGLFAAAVLATQYRDGGGGAWGGRYFLLGLPAIVPVALAALADLADRLDATTRRVALGAAVVGSLALTATAGLTVYDRQWSGQHALDAIEAAVADVPDAVVVAADGPTGRRGWEHVVDGDEWLLAATDEDLAELSARLADEGRPIVLSTVEEDAKVAVVDADYEVVDRRQPEAGSSRVILTLQPR